MYSRILFSAAIFFLVVGLTGCSSDDDNGGLVPTDEVSFNISGDVEGEKSGFASLVHSEDDGILQFLFSDGISGTQTFTLNLYLSNTGQDVELPAQGDYSIGLPAVHDYWVVYSAITDNDAIEYGSTWGAEGTLTITESSSNRISGEFEFTAEGNLDSSGSPTGQIVVTDGSFSVQVP